MSATTHNERRTIRREYINYFLQNPEKQKMFSIRECVRMTEIFRLGEEMRVFYENWS